MVNWQLNVSSEPRKTEDTSKKEMQGSELHPSSMSPEEQGTDPHSVPGVSCWIYSAEDNRGYCLRTHSGGGGYGGGSFLLGR